LQALPIGLAHHVKLRRAIKRDQIVTLDDVDVVDDLDIHSLRTEQNSMLDN